MEPFQGKRVTKEFTHRVSAAPAMVFPLLCPVREYEWIEGWTCRMICSESGVAENNCIFTTDFSRGVDELWVVSRYDPEHYAIEFVVVTPGSHVMKLDLSLSDCGDGSTSVRWTNTFTSLSETGNELIEKFLDTAYPAVMQLRSAALEHYCKTGTMLRING